jgi:hypothetical protein
MPIFVCLKRQSGRALPQHLLYDQKYRLLNVTEFSCQLPKVGMMTQYGGNS